MWLALSWQRDQPAFNTLQTFIHLIYFVLFYFFYRWTQVELMNPTRASRGNHRCAFDSCPSCIIKWIKCEKTISVHPFNSNSTRCGQPVVNLLNSDVQSSNISGWWQRRRRTLRQGRRRRRRYQQWRSDEVLWAQGFANHSSLLGLWPNNIRHRNILRNIFVFSWDKRRL